MVNSSDILSFPEELLVTIFEYCDVQSLGRLARTCKKFRHVIYTVDACWRKKCDNLLFTNMSSQQMQQRSKPTLDCRKRLEVTKKWRNGVSARRTIITYLKCMPWLCLERDYLFCSNESLLVQYSRDSDGRVSNRNMVWLLPHTDDVSKFVINEDEVVTAGRDGMLGRWRKGNLRPINNFRAHNNGVLCVAAKEDVIITGSRDSTVKIWRAFPQLTVLQRQINMGIRVLSVAIMPYNRYYVVGLPGTHGIHPLQLFDFETDQAITTMGQTFRNGAGILDIWPETEFTFLCCGYDTTVKLWDVRSPDKVSASWMDPYDNSVYCVQSDHNVTIVSGAGRSCLVHVWDKRKAGYQFLQQIAELNSPVYSVAFDASHLFVAYDTAALQFTYT